jgi:hypothetical protein
MNSLSKQLIRFKMRKILGMLFFSALMVIALISIGGCKVICQFVCPHDIANRYTLSLPPHLHAARGDTAVGGQILVDQFDADNNMSTAHFLHRICENGIYEENADYGWIGMSNDIARDFMFGYFSKRFPGKTQTSLTPPPFYIVDGTIIDMVTTGKNSSSPDSVLVRLYFQVSQKDLSAYSVFLSYVDSAKIEVKDKQQENIAEAMSVAFDTIATHLCDSLGHHANLERPSSVPTKMLTIQNAELMHYKKIKDPSATIFLTAAAGTNGCENTSIAIRDKNGYTRFDNLYQWTDAPFVMTQRYIEEMFACKTVYNVIHSQNPPPTMMIELTLVDFSVIDSANNYSTSIHMDATIKKYDQNKSGYVFSSGVPMKLDENSSCKVSTADSSGSLPYKDIINSFQCQLISISRNLMDAADTLYNQMAKETTSKTKKAIKR